MAFGNTTASAESLVSPFQYTGRDYDPETGLRYYRARYYDPTAGRFISGDPIGFKGGVNFYAYVNNRPVNMSDSFGLCPAPPRKKGIGFKPALIQCIQQMFGVYTLAVSPASQGQNGSYLGVAVTSNGPPDRHRDTGRSSCTAAQSFEVSLAG